jgi:hypothetical protein
MRSLQFFAATSLSLSAIAAVVGCSSGFVDPFTGSTGTGGSTSTTDPTGGTGTGSSGSGTGGGAGVCPSGSIKDNLLANPSFEDATTWVVTGSPIDYPLASDCSFACGDRVGHIAVKPGGAVGAVVVSQSLNRKIELGSSFTTNARYTYTATYAPYFGVIVNGYPAGGTYVNGINNSKHYSIDNVAVQINDPRRTGVGVQYNMYAGYDDQGMESSFDCFGLTYVPPVGVELLPNGWFDATASEWTGTNSAALTWDNQNGNCGATNGAAHMKVPAGAPDASLRGSVKGDWAAGTKFRFGGAVRPFDPSGTLSNFVLTLHLEYQDDGNNTTDDFLDVPVLMDVASPELWKPAVGEVTATRPVIQADLVQKIGNAATDQDYLADCFSLRAIVAP